jgi:hypothetical protein
MSKIRIYCFNYGDFGAALTQSGTLVAEHWSFGDVESMKDGLGVTSEKNHAVYDSVIGVGKWEVVWIDNISKSIATRAAIDLNIMEGEKYEKRLASA